MSGRRRCAVVGAGLLGLAAASAMTRRGWDTVVFEAAHAPGHALSGSKGEARIFRLGYPDALYVDMALLALTAWRDLEAVTGTRLLRVTGQLTFGSELVAIEQALRTAGIATESLAPTEVARRFPGLEPPGPVLFEPDSGVLAADRCLEAFRAAGEFRVCTDADVVALEDDPDADDVAVVLGGASQLASGGSMRADVVVNCAGPRTLGLIGVAAGPGASLPQVAYFARRDPGAALPPVFIEWGPEMIYGLPVPDNGGPHAGTYKVSHHTPGTPFDPTDPGPFHDDPALLALLTDAAGRLLPALDPVPVATARCVYDNTTDSDFVLDRIGRIVVGCGTSGHAFKFGPLLGELLADLAEGRPPAVDLSRFALARLPR